MFITTDDDTGHNQSIVWHEAFARSRWALSNQLILLRVG